MKSILLTSTALVAFAGAAAADGHTAISHSLSGTLGYNDTVAAAGENENGFYWEGNLKTTGSATLDNGLTAGFYFEVTIAGDDNTANNDGGQALASSDFVLSLTGEGAGLFFGDTSTAATKHWKSAGDMESDGFTTGTNSAVLRGDYSIAGIDVSGSYIIDEAGNTVQQASVGASGSFGSFTFSGAYQEATTFVDSNGDFNSSEVLGVSVGASFAGADITAAYAADTNDGVGQSGVAQQSAGVKVAYPFGPVTVTGYYVQEMSDAAGDPDPNYGINVAYASGPIAVTVDYQDDQTVQKWSVNGSYDIGNGISIIGGAEEQSGAANADPDYYAGAKIDLGGGASFLATYAVDEDGDQADEIGDGDYQEGITVEVSFSF